MSEEYMMVVANGDEYERVTNYGGVKTTICKNRFEVICRDRAEINEQQAVQEFRGWIAKRKQEEMRESGDLPREVS